MRSLIILVTLSATLLLGNRASAEPLVYTGHTFSFAKEAFADPYASENQDVILGDIAISRGNTLGIFNAAVEDAYVVNFSPAGTAWAFKNNNPVETLAASNWAALVFEDWQTATGGQGGGPPATVDQDAVLHLIDQDIYLDIRFIAWGIGTGAGGSFAYERAEITPSADFDRDGDVDGRDFLIWQRGFDADDVLQFDGDANFDGVVDASDLELWQTAYGGALTAFTAVPEPSGLLLAAFLALHFATCRYRNI